MQYAASLITLISQTTPYALEVTGNALAPAIAHGAIVTIKPCPERKPEAVEPGSVALVALATTYPNMFDRSGLYLMNADGDLLAGDTTIGRDKYVLLGVVCDVQMPLDNAPETHAEHPARRE